MQYQEPISVFNYDIFISYKSEEESWAIRLADTLRSFGLKVWRDHDAANGLRVGEVWSDEIKNGIRASKFMIVLWSNLIASNATTVVLEEINEMRKLYKHDETGNRRFVPIILDGTPLNNYPPLAPYHADVSFQALYQKAGPQGANNINTIEWFSTIKNLIDVLGIKDVLEIRFVIAAMTNKQAEELYTKPEVYAQNTAVFKLMVNMMEKTSAFDTKRYGDSPNEWKPFPQLEDNWNIRDLINAYDSEKRNWLQQRNEYAKWILISYSEEMVSYNPQTRNNARQSIQEGPCLVIIDPVSLMHKQVYDNIITNGGLQNHQEAFVIGVAPFVSQMHNDLYNTTIEIEEQLELSLASAYARFKKHFEPVNRACVMNIEHEYQFMRWLQVAADNIIMANKTPLKLKAIGPNPNILRRIRQTIKKQPGAEVIDMSGSGGNII